MDGDVAGKEKFYGWKVAIASGGVEGGSGIRVVG
jgi:hypothetical protein